MMERKNLARRFFLTVGALLFVTGYFAYFAATGAFQNAVCLSVRLFRLYCPACGGTRALLALLKGDILASIGYNPAILTGVLCGGYLCVCYLLAILTGNMKFAKAAKPRILLLFPLVMVLQCIIRNLCLFLGMDFLGMILS